MNRRIALLIAAVVIAGLGTGLVYAYVKSADDRAIEAQAPVTVLVAKLPIAAGTTVAAAAAAGSFESQEFPAGSVTPGALSSVAALSDAVAVTAIFPGQQILGAMFAAAGTATATGGAGLVIPPGLIAVTVEIAVPEERVAGFVVPGSEIVVFSSGVIGTEPDATRVLIPRATVLKTVAPAPQTNPPTATVETFAGTLFTLALSQADAEKIIFASDKGKLFLGLLNPESDVAPGPGVNAGTLFP